MNGLPMLVWGWTPDWTPRTPGTLAPRIVDPGTVIRRGTRTRVDMRTLNLRGKRVGKLTVTGRDDERGRSHWLCDCDCGTKGVSRSQDTLRKSTGADCGVRCPLRAKASRQ